jgi:hypothetical protein
MHLFIALQTLLDNLFIVFVNLYSMEVSMQWKTDENYSFWNIFSPNLKLYGMNIPLNNDHLSTTVVVDMFVYFLSSPRPMLVGNSIDTNKLAPPSVKFLMHNW